MSDLNSNAILSYASVLPLASSSHTVVSATSNAKIFCRNTATMVLTIPMWKIFITIIVMSSAKLISPVSLQIHSVSGPSKHNNLCPNSSKLDFHLKENVFTCEETRK